MEKEKLNNYGKISVEEMIWKKIFKDEEFNEDDYNLWVDKNPHEAFGLLLEIAREAEYNLSQI